jgi:hypothetical protein
VPPDQCCGASHVLCVCINNEAYKVMYVHTGCSLRAQKKLTITSSMCCIMSSVCLKSEVLPSVFTHVMFTGVGSVLSS